ncbi:MAG: Nramp family divalent metal transporter, partial [Candidatus Aminicenantales bacterium]
MKIIDLFTTHARRRGAFAFLRYIGPGLLVTVGFIDPGNWASNIAAGATHGYALLWVVTLGTVMLIVLQHNVAHLGIATGLCLSEATTKHIKPVPARFILGSAVLASISTALAEILGGAIGLRMLIPGLPLQAGAVLVTAVVMVMLFTNSYPKLERWIIGFVSLIGLAFVYELTLVHVPWGKVAV